MPNNFKPILYGVEDNVEAAGVRAVLITLKALKVDYEFRLVNTMRREQLAEYLKKNPAQIVPTLEIEPGRFIGDSHAIMAYLVDRYGGHDNPLYPKDAYKRAKVDEVLHFENGILFITCIKETLMPIFAGLRDNVSRRKLNEMENAYDTLELAFGDNAYVAAEHITIADFSCFVTVGTLNDFNRIKEEKHPKLYAWFAYMKSLPYAENVPEGAATSMVKRFLESKYSKL